MHRRLWFEACCGCEKASGNTRTEVEVMWLSLLSCVCLRSSRVEIVLFSIPVMDRASGCFCRSLARAQCSYHYLSPRQFYLDSMVRMLRSVICHVCWHVFCSLHQNDPASERSRSRMLGGIIWRLFWHVLFSLHHSDPASERSRSSGDGLVMCFGMFLFNLHHSDPASGR